MTQLKTILDTVSASVLPIKFAFQETMPTSFPSGNIIFLGGEEKMLDSVTNELIEQFVVRLIFAENESAAAMTQWMTLVDTIGDTFRKDDYQTLVGNAVAFQVKKYAPPVSSTDFGSPVVIFDIAMEAKTIKQINL